MTRSTTSSERPHSGTGTSGGSNVDPDEVRRFAGLAREWWDPDGKFRPLHRMGPARLGFIRDALCERFQRDARGLRPLTGLSVLDVGCGGGLVCEPMARLGATITGIEPTEENIAAACSHAHGQDLVVDYVATTAEAFSAEGRQFDAVLCLEVVEHVPDVAAFLRTIASLVKPGGIAVLSTLNRTLKSYALAIGGAEFVLRWVPVGTHQWARFLTPEELAGHLSAAAMAPTPPRGMIYTPFPDTSPPASDVSVNYLMTATRD